MRPASSRVVTLWITVLCLLTALFSLNNLASAQPGAKRAQHSRAANGRVHPLVTTDTWIGGTTGNWSTASNWNNGAITSGEDIVIGTTTAATTVDQSFDIGTLTLSKSGDSATIANGINLQVGGNISNAGTITLDSTSTYVYLQINGNITLSGAGTLVLGGTAPYDTVYATTAGNVLTNDSTITGQGTIGDGNLVIDNTSTWTINANVSGDTLLLNPYTSTASTNAGTLEATNGGTLELQNGSWTNTGGNITAATGSSVVLSGTTITGGTVTGTGTGVVYGENTATLVGVTIAGNFNVPNGQTTLLSGTITNTGTITLNSTSTYSELQILPAGATLSGGGTVIMGAGAQYGYIQAESGSATFTNSNNTIEGTGQLGNGSLAITNNGTINANVSPTVLNSPLELSSDSGGITNTNILEATNGGELEIYNSTVTNSGTIEAIGADSSSNPSYVVLSGSTINGGTLTTSGAGVIYGENGSVLVGVTNSGNFNVPNGQYTYLSGTITNSGTMTLNSTSTYSQLELDASTTLTGKGTIVMGAGAAYSIIGNAGTSGYTLTNSNNTIEGDGYIGYGVSIFVNNGTVNANVSGGTLEIQPVSAGTDTNTATMEATNGGTLELYTGTFDNTGGTITAAASSSVILSSTTVNGGTLTTSGTGATAGVVYGENGSVLVGVTNSGNFNVPNGQYTYLSGTITNSGTMTLNSTSTYSQLYLDASTTLTGKGTIVMGAGAAYSILGNAGTSGYTLTNSNNTIEGDGYIGYSESIFVNNGTVNANVSGGTLYIQPISAGTDTNTATMEATNGGTLELEGGSFTNTGGTITAAASSSVVLYGTTVTGGTLTTSGTGSTAGVIYAENYSEIVGLTNSGNLNIPNGYALYTSGTITNSGTITLNSTSTYTTMDLEGNTTLSGSGKVVMGAGAQYSIIGDNTSTTYTLTNSGNTIEGYGSLGDDQATIDNKSGSIIANVSGGTLTIQSAGAGTTNNGTLETESGGLLTVVGTLTNYSSSTNTLTGGTYIANGSNMTLPLGSSGGITTLSASITEENGGQILNSNNSNNNALNGLTTITSTGSLTIGGVAFTDTGAFSNAGSLTILGGESFNVASLTQISSGSLTAGTYVLDADLNLTGTAQTITTNAANLTLAGGTIENTSNSTNALAGLATNTGTLTIGAAVSTTASSFSNTGTMTIDKGDSFTAAKLTQISGTTLSGGTFVLIGNLDLTTSGISVTTNSSTLTLEGGTINSNGVNALSALASNTKTLTIDAAVTTSAAFSNTGTLTIDKSESFTAPSLTQISSGSLTGGTYVLIGNLDLTTSGITVTTNEANLTLEGGTINSNGVNALSALASNTGTLTIDAAVTTTASSFSNTGTLTIDKSESFTAPALTQISGTTLTAGTYVLAGNLDLTGTANITTNSAKLTLEGGEIKTGSTNDLANLNSNTGTLTLASDASITTSTTANFTNTGTVDVEKGSTLTVGGTSNQYNQTAGTTTVDGTISVGSSGSDNITGGTILGAGTIKANTTVGNASGATATINAGDSGAAGLLTITGTYKQLATGVFTGFVNGTTADTGYSQMKVSGTASLAGTINFTVSSSFMSSLKVGQTFIALTASSISGTFSNSTIAINSTFQFDVTYNSTEVILTVADVADNASPAQSAAAKPTSSAVAKNRVALPISGLRHGSDVSKVTRPVVAVGWAPSSDRVSGLSDLRIWEHVPVTASPVWPVAVARVSSVGNEISPRVDLPSSERMGENQAIGIQAPLAHWVGTSNRREPVKILPTMLPRLMR